MSTNAYNEPTWLVQYRDFATRTFFKLLLCAMVAYQVYRNVESPVYMFLWIFIPGVIMIPEGPNSVRKIAIKISSPVHNDATPKEPTASTDNKDESKDD